MLLLRLKQVVLVLSVDDCECGWLFWGCFFLIKKTTDLFIFKWGIMALQYCFGFCHTSAWISHRYTYIPSLWNFLPIFHPSHPARLSPGPGFSSLSHKAHSHWLSILHMGVYTFPCNSLCSSMSTHPDLPMSTSLFSMSASPLLPCKEVHHHHLPRFHIYVFIYDICFSLSDLLHSVW